MRHHHKESHLLQHHVGIDIDEGITTQFYTTGRIFLNGKLVDSRTVVRGVVFREISSIGSQLHSQHLGNTELQVEVGEDVPGG